MSCSNNQHEHGEGSDTPDGVELTLNAEAEESTENSYAGYITLLMIVLAIAIFGRMYFNSNSADFRADIYNHNVPGDAKFVNLVELTPYEKGEKIYKSACVACHQPDGNGLPGQFPPLAGSEWVTGPKEVSTNVILNGLMGPIEVKGVSYNGAMPPLGAALSDEDIAAVVTFIRGNKDWGNEASEVSPDEVKAIRAEADGKGQWKGSDLLKLYPLK